MTSRELVIKTLRHEPVERVPRDLWTLPGVRAFRQDELVRMLKQFPLDFEEAKFTYGRGDRVRGIPSEVGRYTDAYGSVWYVAEPGVVGEVKEFPLSDWSALESFRLPYEILDNADLSSINRGCAETDKFVLAGSTVRPFERIQFLRGSEAVYIDLACGSPELMRLLEMLHEFYIRELNILAATDVDGVTFMDDWGAQTSLLISPGMWRGIFKPLYRDYCDILHEKGKYAFFHSDGYIEPIIEDLIEIGVDALNSQLFCMNIEEIGEKYRGRITFWGEIDRQNILPFGTEQDARDAVGRLRRALDRGNGGVIAQCEWGITDPYENIAAVFDEWNQPLKKIFPDE